MSGIYIPGMEMPKNCDKCVFMAEADDYYVCYITEKPIDWRWASETSIEQIHDKPDWCPLVSVPNHGQLIDADALMRSFHDEFDDEEVHDFECGAYWFHDSVINHVINSPTIIPADKDGADDV